MSVVRLPGVSTSAGGLPADQRTVAILKDALHRAELGEFRGILLIGIEPMAQTDRIRRVATLQDGRAVLAALSMEMVDLANELNEQSRCRPLADDSA